MEEVRSFSGNFYGEFMEIICLKAPYIGETETPHFYDFGIFGYVNLSLETQDTSTKSRKYRFSLNMILIISKFCQSMFCQFWRRRAPTNPDDPSRKILKFLDMRSISIQSMEWNSANMDKISVKKH